MATQAQCIHTAVCSVRHHDHASETFKTYVLWEVRRDSSTFPGTRARADGAAALSGAAAATSACALGLSLSLPGLQGCILHRLEQAMHLQGHGISAQASSR